jgi:hypothetical protein
MFATGAASRPKRITRLSELAACLVLEHEVAGIEQMKLNLRKVAFVRMRTVWE